MATPSPSPIRRPRPPAATRPVLILSLPFLLGAAGLHAQADPRPAVADDAAAAVLEGTVLASDGTDPGAAGEDAGTPLPGAEVWILGTGIGTLADDEGRFRLAGLPPGRYRLLVGARGHREAVVTVDVAARETGRVRVRLETLEEDLERRAAALSAEGTLTGTGAGHRGFRQRMASGLGEYVTRAEIDAADTRRLSDVIRTYTSADVQPCSKGSGTGADCFWVVSGMRFRMGGVEGGVALPPEAAGGNTGIVASLRSGGSPHGSAGKPCVADVYLDGVSMNQEAHPNGIDLVAASELEGIEVYRRGALAPARFRSMGGCGVVLLWSRRAEGGGSG